MAKWWTLVAVCVATFMLLLDITVVNVALPYIERDLDASFEDLQWVIDAYALTLAAFLLTAGSIADDLGRRRDLRRRARGLHRRLGAVRAGRLAADAQPRARAAGRRRRDDVRHRAGAARHRPTRAATAAPRSACGEPPPARPWRSGRWSAACSSRPAAGRRSSSSTCRSASARSRSRSRACRSRATRTASRSTGPARSRSRPRSSSPCSALIRGNAEDWSAAILACLAGAAVLLVVFVIDRAARAPADPRPRAVPQARVLRRLGRRVRAVGVDVRDVPLPHALRAEHPRLQRARVRACASCRSR